jgi:uncharacterized membrane protein
MVLFYPTAVTPQVIAGRFSAFDRLRGLIMIVMAIDHASFFIARVHFYEAWSTSPVEAVTITRWITHLCAPGIFMLMGASMVWLGKARQKAGWDHGQIRWFFIKRGLVLLLVQQFIENIAWITGELTAARDATVQLPQPGGGSDPFLVFLVISALAASMIFWSFLIELPSIVIAAVAGAAMAASWYFMPPASEAATLFPYWRILLFTPSHHNFLQAVYSWVPWLAPSGLGIILGRIIYKKPGKIAVIALSGAAVLIVAHFVVGHSAYGAFYKYPPTPAFLTITLGIDLLLLAVLTIDRLPLAPLEVFGRSPLFFYLLHLYVFAALSPLFRHGTSYPVMYAVWAAGIVVMYPMVKKYGEFKASKPVTSMWRLF